MARLVEHARVRLCLRNDGFCESSLDVRTQHLTQQRSAYRDDILALIKIFVENRSAVGRLPVRRHVL